MLSGVGCVAKGSGDVGVFGVPKDAGRGRFQESEEKQEEVIVARHDRGCRRFGVGVTVDEALAAGEFWSSSCRRCNNREEWAFVAVWIEVKGLRV